MVTPLILTSLVLAFEQVPSARVESECAAGFELPKGRTALSARSWTPEAHDALAAAIAKHGADARGYNPCQRPLAVLDFDGTVIDGDIGVSAFALAMERGLLQGGDTFFALLPAPEGDTLRAAWPAEGGRFDGRARAAVHEIHSWLCRERGKSACSAWLAKAFVGLDRTALDLFAAEAIDEALARGPSVERLEAPDGRPAIEVSRGARLRPEMVELVEALLHAGFDVYLVTEAPEWLVGAFAARIGLPPRNVIGMRSIVGSNGRTVATVAPPEPYGSGKVIAIRTRIPPGGRVPIIAVGDSEGDRELLDQAADVAVLLDRGDAKLRALAKARAWRIQPAPGSSPVP